MGVSKWILGLATALSWWAAIGAVLAPAGVTGAVYSIGPGAGGERAAWLDPGRSTPAASSARANRSVGERAGPGPAVVLAEAGSRAGPFGSWCPPAPAASIRSVRGHASRVTRGPPSP